MTRSLPRSAETWNREHWNRASPALARAEEEVQGRAAAWDRDLVSAEVVVRWALVRVMAVHDLAPVRKPAVQDSALVRVRADKDSVLARKRAVQDSDLVRWDRVAVGDLDSGLAVRLVHRPKAARPK